RLFVGNFDFETQLARRSNSPSAAALQRVVAELAPVWIPIADDDDRVWCPEPVDSTFFDRMQQHGLPRVRPISQLSDVPSGCELVPWGWTEEIIRWGRAVGARIKAPPLDVVRLTNSRRFSHQLEVDWGLGLPDAAAAETMAELMEAIDRISGTAPGWVVKAEFSHSSRERWRHLSGSDVDRTSLMNWAQRRLQAGQHLFVEPWVDRIDEIGVQIRIPPNGDPPCVEGLTQLLVDDAGRFRGSEFTPEWDDDPAWRNAVSAAVDAARIIQQRGYFGPVGIDAMRYRNASGDVVVRPLQDINGRWTMGRLSLGYRKLLTAGQRGYWRHGSRGETAVIDPSRVPRYREFATSPPTIGGRAVRLTSHVEIITGD
ncbi:MAG: hypothetical protein KF861_07800, partial [Planctomycetaceae bacterium]|nr:hypothetical protein [Planctomycetaceae bacterium]